jgi:hypothetical protein
MSNESAACPLVLRVHYMTNPSRHAHDRNWLENIALKIPGFKGYLEKEYRRESDYLARKALADRLQRAKPALDSYMRNLMDAGQLDSLTQVERIRTRLDGLINQLRSDVRGYSGIFDFVKVREDLLEQVYEHDMSLLDDVNALGDSLDALSASSAPVTETLPTVMKQLDEVERLYARRGDLLKGLGPDA